MPSIIFLALMISPLSTISLQCEFPELKEYDGKPKVNHVTVFERPGLKEFLNQSSEFADLVLFTAGLEGLQCHCSILLPFDFTCIFFNLSDL